MSKILVVDDEQSICWGLAQLGEGLGHEVQTAASAEQGLAIAAGWPADLLILDVRLPGIDGLSAMERFRERLGAVPIVVITAFGDLATAVRSVKHGAFEYVVKPFDLADIRAVVQRALRRDRPVVAYEQDAGEVDDMLGCSPAMQDVFKRIALAANSEAAVLLHGESGVGKELAARAIHQHSRRCRSSFVAVNVAALSSSLAESELFGHTANAFTGAHQERNGLLVEADGGTLFLDEVADIPLALQVKLLRVLDRGEVLPVGADRPVRTEFRIVSATHQDLPALVRAGKFRHDLYYRLSAFQISLPALRERAEDIELLARAFVRRFGGPDSMLSAETLAALRRRAWFGNVRELRNAIEHALVMARAGLVLPEHLPPPQPQLVSRVESDETVAPLEAAWGRRAEQLLDDPSVAGNVYDKFLSEAERPLLAGAMKRFDNECAPAARALGMHRTTLKRKLDQYGIATKPRSEQSTV